MITSKYLSSRQFCRIFTNLRPATIRRLAAKGQLPVVAWLGTEPFFERDEETIRAMVNIARCGHVRK
jgi:hypothetical protein